MPYIHISTNAPAPFCQEGFLHNQLARAMTLLPGMEADWTMTHVQTACDLWFAGSDAPAAIAEVSVYGELAQCGALTARLTEILEHAFEIDPQRIYIKYTSAPQWGCGGENYR